MHGEKQSQMDTSNEEQNNEVKKIQQLVGLIEFAKSL
jgi:hypothetical protein